jgi:hypothetical protein
MGIAQRVGYVPQDPDRFGNRQLALAAEPGPQRLALDERHAVVQERTRFAGTRPLAGGEQRDDKGMLQRGCQLDLAVEPIDAQARRELWWEDFDYDLSAECGLLGDEDAAHASAAQLALERVAAG